MDPKGVSAIHGRWIEDGHAGLKEKEETGRGWRG